MKRFEQVVGAVISSSVAFIIISIAVAVFSGCGGQQVVQPESGPYWYELYWTEDEQGQRYVVLCGAGPAHQKPCVEVGKLEIGQAVGEVLPEGCTVSVDSDDEIRCEKEVR